MYRSVDVSEYACEQFAHECRDISTWRPGAPSDLVVCQGVLQYLGNEPAEAAIENLAVATRYVMYLEVPTLFDRDNIIDRTYTDMDCKWRSADWYRKRLAPHFTQIGAGLWAKQESGLKFYELERSR
jgi:trans-aconitate methyltransferase